MVDMLADFIVFVLNLSISIIRSSSLPREKIYNFFLPPKKQVAKEEITILETVTEHLRNELVRMKEEFAANHSELETQLMSERAGRSQQEQELELVREEWEKERTLAESMIGAKKAQVRLRGTRLRGLWLERDFFFKNYGWDVSMGF